MNALGGLTTKDILTAIRNATVSIMIKNVLILIDNNNFIIHNDIIILRILKCST